MVHEPEASRSAKPERSRKALDQLCIGTSVTKERMINQLLITVLANKQKS